MLVWGSSKIKDINFKNPNTNKWYDNWYKFVFVDGGDKTIQNINMQQELINKSTYIRWQNYGTLYGITRCSFVCLTDRSDFGKDIIYNHIKTMYFQLVTLVLVQRASIIRFSDEVTAISDIGDDKDISTKISNLYKNYLRFKNKLYFKEITAQEQGIEIYDKAREIIRIDSDIQDLTNEIGLLNHYAFVLDEQDEKKQMNKLTKLGTIFLPGTFIAGFFGMNVFGSGWFDNIAGFILASSLIVYVTWYLTERHNIDVKEFLIGKKYDKK